MPNLRLIYDNAADRATLTASSTAGALVASNLQTDLKGQIHRSTGTSVSYTLTWAAGEGISAAAIPACNLSASATIRVRLYSDAAGTVLLADSGTLFACPGAPLGEWDWSAPINANSFIFGGYSKTAVWFSSIHFARRCVIDLIDTDNPAGHIDAARLVAGVYWSPAHGAGHGVQASVTDESVISRNDAGDLLADRGAQHETLSVPLPYITEADRARLMQIFRYVGTAQNFFFSLFAGDGMSLKEQDHMLFGKRSNGSINFDFFNAHSTKIEMEGW
jgi:hypothetical protein